MKTNDDGIELIKHFESLHDGDLTLIGIQPKKDPIGIWTIAYGHALIDPVTKRFLKGDADKAAAYKVMTDLTLQQAEDLLQSDLITFEKHVDSYVKVTLTENQFSALVSFAFNVGAGNLKSSTLLRLLNTGMYDLASKEFIRWNKGEGKVLRGLTLRREAEAKLFLTA
jgi:lysozyme